MGLVESVHSRGKSAKAEAESLESENFPDDWNVVDLPNKPEPNPPAPIPIAILAPTYQKAIAAHQSPPGPPSDERKKSQSATGPSPNLQQSLPLVIDT